MEQVKICIYAICKDEVECIDKWMESMSEADYICVLDTGSTDGTYEKFVELAKTNSKLFVDQKVIKPWRFDVARNESMKLIPTDANVLLCTDLDELLDPGWGNVIRRKWKVGFHQEGHYKYIWSHGPNGEPGRVFYYNKMHCPGWEWKYPVHEMVSRIPDIVPEPDNPSEVICDMFDEITLQHWPKPKTTRSSYLPLLKLRKQENKDDYYGLIYLAHEYMYRGEFQNSIDELQFILDNYRDKYDSLEQASCYLFMGDAYMSLEKHIEALEAYRKGIELEFSYRECYLGAARALMSMKRWREAESYIIEGLTASWRHYNWLERDTSWKEEPYDLLSLATYYGGKKKEALAYAVKACSLNPTDDRLKDNVKLILENMENTDFF